jgi:recombination protein RecT
MSDTNTLEKVQAPATIRDALAKMLPEITKVLPKHMKPERMLRVALTTINSNQKLLKCTQSSLLAALMRCSQAGLEPDGRMAHLIPFKDQCQLIFDYKGLIDMVRRDGSVGDIHADVVYENDEFDYEYGDKAFIRHKPTLKGDRGKPYASYSYARLKDGKVTFEVLRWDEVMTIRDNSQGYKAFVAGYANSSPWKTNESEMAKKTAFRRHTKWLPFSSEVREFMEDDDSQAEDIDTRIRNAKPALVTESLSLPEPNNDDKIPDKIVEPEKVPVGAKREESKEPLKAEAGKVDPARTQLNYLMLNSGFKMGEIYDALRAEGLIDEVISDVDDVSVNKVKVIIQAWPSVVKMLDANKS